jgi:serine protease
MKRLGILSLLGLLSIQVPAFAGGEPSVWVPSLPLRQQGRTYLSLFPEGTGYVLGSQRPQSNDPLIERQWGLKVIQAPEAWGIADGEGAIIAVIDTGADLMHPDLRSQFLGLRRTDFVDATGGDGPVDENGHGTFVSGIAAAMTGNGVGVAGVAPRARIMPIRVCDATGTCEEGPAARGIRYAASHGADVINLSFGFGYVTSRADQGNGPLDRAVRDAWGRGAVIVAAAGNNSLPICAEPAATLGVPVLCIGATDQNDLPAAYSNFDATLTTNYLVAPGGSATNGLLPQADCEGGIWSTALRSAAPSPCSDQEGFDVSSGTSFAAPFVAGVAALLASQGLTNEEIVQTIISNTDDLGAPGRDPRFGFGRVNALQAVQAAPA